MQQIFVTLIVCVSVAKSVPTDRVKRDSTDWNNDGSRRRGHYHSYHDYDIEPLRFRGGEPSSRHLGGRPEEENEDSSITFPDDEQGDVLPIVPRYLTPKADECGPVCGKGAEFCEQDEAYPSEYLTRVLKKFSPREFREVYGDDNFTYVTADKVGERIDYVDEISLCGTLEHTIYPKVAKNKEDNWLFVVNQGEYIQGIRLEKCLNDGSPCQFNDGAPAGLKTVCRQKFIYRKLLALNAEGNTITDSFRLPSCCACFVKSKFLVENRRAGFSPRRLCPVPGDE